MSKIEIGTIVTLILAIIGGALWIGDLNGRVKSIEGGGAIIKIQKATDESLKKIGSENEKTISLFESIDNKSSLIPVGTIIAFLAKFYPKPKII